MNGLLKRVGIEVPILQAPIGSASSPALVAAVSNAGGLGMLAGTWLPPSELRTAIRKIRRLTARPFAVNLGVHAAPEEKVELCLKELVPVISLFWGDARKYFGKIASGGSRIIATVGFASEAAAAAEAGADVIIAQGFEAGGHVWGKVGTCALLPEVVDAVGGVPVIAAGGIGDGRTFAAALVLGASGICLGTRFIAATESWAHPVYKRLIIEARAEDTYYGNIFEIGWPNAPHRVLMNSSVSQFLQSARKQASGQETVAHAADGTAIPRFSSRLPIRSMTGNIESMALYAGQSVSFCHRTQPAAEIVRELMEDFQRWRTKRKR